MLGLGSRRGAGGLVCRRQVVRFGLSQVRTCEVGSRPVPGGGSRLSLEKARTQRVAGGCPPPPRFRGRSFPLARFGGCGALSRWWGYFGAHLRALIWIRILRERGLGEKVFRGGAYHPRRLPPGGRLWVGKPSFRVSDTCRPTDSPGRAHPAGPGSSPQKGPKGLAGLSAQRTRPAGHASQSSAGRSRRKRMQSCFDRLRRPKHTSQPPVCPQGARSGCNPPILGGASHQAEYPTPPYTTLPNEA